MKYVVKAWTSCRSQKAHLPTSDFDEYNTKWINHQIWFLIQIYRPIYEIYKDNLPKHCFFFFFPLLSILNPKEKWPQGEAH